MSKKSIFFITLLLCFIASFAFAFAHSEEEDVNFEMLENYEIPLLDCDHVSAYCVPVLDTSIWCYVETPKQTLFCTGMRHRTDND